MDDVPEVTSTVQRRRVAVLGCGTAGLGAAWAVKQYTSCDVVVFERHGNVGGLWLYQDPLTGNHTSMYEGLRVNVPIEMMPYPAFRKLPESAKKLENSFPYREVFQEYMDMAATELGVRALTRFGTSVVKAERVGELWKLTLSQDGNTTQDMFDYLLICNGHHEARLVPPELQEKFPLLDKDPRFVHSADYNTASTFRGCKNVLVVGSASSGMDISMQIAEEAEKVSVFVRPTSAMLQRPIGDKVEVITDLGDPGRFDGAVFCTGYAVHLPFLAPELRNTSDLLLHTFSKEARNLFFIGLPQRVPPAALYQLQGMVVAGVISGQIELPSASEFGPRQFDGDKASAAEPCTIGSHEYYAEEHLRLRHEIGPELRGYWNFMCDLVATMDASASARLKNEGEVLISVYLEALGKRAAGGLGNDALYRNESCKISWNADGTADVQWTAAST
mmetsp:Transcript_70660/g.132234  ORF Transcript_70660/g.132234 Transcript_70660/m.132234 type:complete len:447 (+) Transcript_70660:62-1402(+)